jgi:hypothetical protein
MEKVIKSVLKVKKKARRRPIMSSPRLGDRALMFGGEVDDT